MVRGGAVARAAVPPVRDVILWADATQGRDMLAPKKAIVATRLLWCVMVPSAADNQTPQPGGRLPFLPILALCRDLFTSCDNKVRHFRGSTGVQVNGLVCPVIRRGFQPEGSEAAAFEGRESGQESILVSFPT